MGNAATTILEEVARAGGRLLRVSRDPAPGAGGRCARLVLTFDVGNLALAIHGGVLEGRALEPAEAAAVDAAEEEPWWALLGNPLTRVLEQPGGAVLVQFRADEASPRLVLLEPSAEAVSVRSVA